MMAEGPARLVGYTENEQSKAEQRVLLVAKDVVQRQDVPALAAWVPLAGQVRPVYWKLKDRRPLPSAWNRD